MKNPKELHEEFVKLGREKSHLMNKLLLILPEIYKSGIWKKYESDIYKYAGRFGGISKSAVEKRLKLEKHLEDKPQLRAAIAQVGVHKVALLATLATEKSEAAFADKALNMSKSALEMLSKELRNKQNIQSLNNNLFDTVGCESQGFRETDDIRFCQAKPQTIKVELDEEMAFLFMKFKQNYKNLSNKEAMRELLKKVNEIDTKNMMASKGQAQAKTSQQKSITGDENSGGLEEQSKTTTGDEAKTKTTSRYIPANQKRQVIGDGQCAYPSCNRPFENFHHPERYAKTKNHKTLIALCKQHHEFMHNGLIENETAKQQLWKVNLYKNIDHSDNMYRKYRQG